MRLHQGSKFLPHKRYHPSLLTYPKTMVDLRALRFIWWAGACFAAYIVLDILCGPPMRYQPINPVWHPAAGLAVFMLARAGWRALSPFLLAAIVSSLMIPVLPTQPIWSIFIGLLPFPGYFTVAIFMQRYLDDGEFLKSHNGLIRWTAALTIASIISGVLYSSVVLGIDSFGSSAWLHTLIRYSVAEVSGMIAFISLAYYLANYEWRFNFLAKIGNWETVAYMALIVMVLWIALDQPPKESMTYYLLLLPLAWAAARQGMAGAIMATIVLEVCVMAATFLPGPYAARIPDVQMLVLTLTLSGFLIGVAVDVARRASDDLRQSLRLAAAGEMAGALAHELNQPLTALTAYGSACARLIEQDGGNLRLENAVRAMTIESERAANVLKRLRDYFLTGTTQLECLQLAELIATSTKPFHEQARNEDVEFVVDSVPNVSLLGDRVQLEIVLRNLLANAFQAVTQQTGNLNRKVTVDAGSDADFLWVRIIDNGPGIANRIRARLFEPFISLKSSGMGLGLAISRSILVTHGGTLSIEPSTHGVLKITLPIEKNINEVSDAIQP